MPEFRHQTRRTAIGAGLIVVLAATGLLIFFLDELTQVGEDTYRIVAVFMDAPQLQEGAAVWIAGHQVGHVDRVAFLPPAGDSAPRVAAVLELPAEVQPLVRRDSELRLKSERPLGKHVIDVTPGTAAARPLGAGDTLRAGEDGRLDDVSAEAARFGAALDSLLATASALDSLLARRAPGFQRAAAALEAAQLEFGHLTAALEGGPLAEFLADSEWRAALGRLRELSAEIAGAFRDADGSPRADLGPAFRRVARHARLLGERLDGLQSLLAASGGFPSRMARDSALAVAMHGVRAQLDSLVVEARKEPWKFIF